MKLHDRIADYCKSKKLDPDTVTLRERSIPSKEYPRLKVPQDLENYLADNGLVLCKKPEN